MFCEDGRSRVDNHSELVLLLEPVSCSLWSIHKIPLYIYTSSFARFSYSECGLRSLTHMGVMRQGGNVTKFL